eukprot:6543499-Pyramimonas_sp.AAC.1
MLPTSSSWTAATRARLLSEASASGGSRRLSACGGGAPMTASPGAGCAGRRGCGRGCGCPAAAAGPGACGGAWG